MNAPFLIPPATPECASLLRELVGVGFAGGGGSCLGIKWALGRSPDFAINHDADALAMHAINHPETRHLNSNIWKVNPDEVEPGQPIGAMWFSPDCKHFSKAKGGKPLARNIRDLAWIVVLWAKRRLPRVIFLENVEEFRDWGPLGADDMPIAAKRGATFKKWVGQLKKLGYRVEHRELRACDYGAPTIRRRLFLIARRDGRPIIWPAATHGDPKLAAVKSGKLLPWRTAAEIIDWTLPCPSIFLTRQEGRAIGCNRPLADNTMARIAKGVKRYVIDAAQPFIVPVTHSGDSRVHGVDEPLRTVTTAPRGEHALVSPVIAGCGGRAGQSRPRGGDEPLATVTAKADAVLAAVHLTKFNTGSIGASLDDPAPTVTANSFVKRPGGAAPIGVVAAHLSRQFGASVGSGVEEPVGTVTAGGGGKTALVAASLAAYYGKNMDGGDRVAAIADPLRTVTTENRHAVVAAFLAQHNTDMVGHSAEEPVSTIVQKGPTQAVVSAGLLSMRSSDQRSRSAQEPHPTVTAQGNHSAEVRAFLVKYYGSEGQAQTPADPLHTVPTKPRFGVVIVAGEPYEIVDIGMRMLRPRELFRAQGFPDSYIIDRRTDGSAITATVQVRCCGNSVSPVMARALIAANFVPHETFLEAAE